MHIVRSLGCWGNGGSHLGVHDTTLDSGHVELKGLVLVKH